MNKHLHIDDRKAAIDRYIETLRQIWSQSTDVERLSEQTCSAMRSFLAGANASTWLDRLWQDKPRSWEMYRDDVHGFVQMAHYHAVDHRTPPHDHGPHWVVYGVARGCIEITTYRAEADAKAVRIEERQILSPSIAHVYPVGAIHSTRQLDPQGSIVLRFLSQDLSAAPRQRFAWDDIVE